MSVQILLNSQSIEEKLFSFDARAPITCCWEFFRCTDSHLIPTTTIEPHRLLQQAPYSGDNPPAKLFLFTKVNILFCTTFQSTRHPAPGRVHCQTIHYKETHAQYQLRCQFIYHQEPYRLHINSVNP